MNRGDENSLVAAQPAAAADAPPGEAPAPRPEQDSLLSDEAYSGDDVQVSSRHPHRIRVGSLIAQRYEVLGTLGEGGMGIVYRCRDRHAGELVAVKRVIPP